MKKLLLLFLLFSMENLLAESLSYLARTKPNPLAYQLELGKYCPFSIEEISQIIQTTALKKSIKPASDSQNNFHMHIRLSCRQVKWMEKNNLLLYQTNVKYGRWKPAPAMYFSADYSQFGIADQYNLLNVFGKNLEDALSDYVTANVIET